MDQPTCAHCGATITRRNTKGPNRPPRFCSAACFNLFRRVTRTKEDGRRHARADFPLQPCEVCGAVNEPGGRGGLGLIHRHHRDGDQTNNVPANIAFLCKADHDAEHRRMAMAHVGRTSGGRRPRVYAMQRDRAAALAAIARGYRAAGWKVDAIAAELGVHPMTIHRWFRKYPA